jgi:hypothetical protein
MGESKAIELTGRAAGGRPCGNHFPFSAAVDDIDNFVYNRPVLSQRALN